MKQTFIFENDVTVIVIHDDHNNIIDLIWNNFEVHLSYYASSLEHILYIYDFAFHETSTQQEEDAQWCDYRLFISNYGEHLYIITETLNYIKNQFKDRHVFLPMILDTIPIQLLTDNYEVDSGRLKLVPFFLKELTSSVNTDIIHIKHNHPQCLFSFEDWKNAVHLVYNFHTDDIEVELSSLPVDHDERWFFVSWGRVTLECTQGKSYKSFDNYFYKYAEEGLVVRGKFSNNWDLVLTTSPKVYQTIYWESDSNSGSFPYFNLLNIESNEANYYTTNLIDFEDKENQSTIGKHILLLLQNKFITLKEESAPKETVPETEEGLHSNEENESTEVIDTDTTNLKAKVDLWMQIHSALAQLAKTWITRE